jgi:hypothetical protein
MEEEASDRETKEISKPVVDMTKFQSSQENEQENRR